MGICLAICVAGHGVASTFNPDRDALAAIDVPALTKAIDTGRAHVAVLGARHSTTEIESRIWYAGSPEVTSRREDDPGNATRFGWLAPADADHRQHRDRESDQVYLVPHRGSISANDKRHKRIHGP